MEVHFKIGRVGFGDEYKHHGICTCTQAQGISAASPYVEAQNAVFVIVAGHYLFLDIQIHSNGWSSDCISGLQYF
jgi:hypothetical protein